jgi:hypothetical protein
LIKKWAKKLVKITANFSVAVVKNVRNLQTIENPIL